MLIRPFTEIDRPAVLALWSQTFDYSSPHNNPNDAIDRKLAVHPELFFIAEIDGQLVGTAMAGYDGHRGWLYSVATHPERRRKRIATALMQHAEAALAARNCPKVNLQTMPNNTDAIAFYESLGYAVENRTSMGKRLAPPPQLSDAQLFAAFESQSIPRPQWTHRAHVKIAYLYLTKFPFPDALEKIRIGIQKLNAANKVEESSTSGYNETTTVAFAHLVAATLAAYSPVFPTPTADAFCDTHRHLLSPTILRLYYSPTQRMHPDAKAKFVEPDLAPLPRIRLIQES